MCEILVLKENDKDLRFSQDAIEDAILANRDGAGYIVLEKNKGNYDLVDVKHYETKEPTPPTTVTTWAHGVKVERVEDPKKETIQLSLEEIFTDYEWEHSAKRIILETPTGNTLKMNYPKELGKDAKITETERMQLLMEWLDDRKIIYDFTYYDKNDFTAEEIEAMETLYKQHEEEQGTYVEKRYEIVAKEMYMRQWTLQKNQLMIMHFRLATVGNKEKNIQPIVKENLITIHNGVFTSLGSAEKSDTHEFTENLQKLMEISKIKTNKEEEAFIRTFLDITQGWYSTFIYSIKTKQLYYFKNGASFYSFADKIMYSTKETRFPISTEATTKFE